jgi:outer membrane protein OmpA-like peptidoglycan-associated protein
MKAGQNNIRLFVCSIMALTMIGCTKPKPEPIVPPLPEVTKKYFPAKVVKDHYLYKLDPALCQETEQFMVMENQAPLPVPEKAIQFNIQKFRPSSSDASKAQGIKSINNALTVFFDVNASAIDVREAKKLDRFIKQLPPAAEVKITGYTCRLGSAEYNQKLARDRATAISRFLTKQGVHVQSVTGKAGCCYISDKDPTKNRRAEILICPSKDIPILETNAGKEVVKENSRK